MKRILSHKEARDADVEKELAWLHERHEGLSTEELAVQAFRRQRAFWAGKCGDCPHKKPSSKVWIVAVADDVCYAIEAIYNNRVAAEQHVATSKPALGWYVVEEQDVLSEREEAE